MGQGEGSSQGAQKGTAVAEFSSCLLTSILRPHVLWFVPGVTAPGLSPELGAGVRFRAELGIP